MERIALISDIHSNLTALNAVVKDIKRRGIKRIVCLGDFIGKGPQPSETVEAIRSLCEVTLQGNWEDGMLNPQEKESGRWQQRRLTSEQLQYMAHLPFSYDIMLSGKRIRLFHASADSVHHRVYPKSDKKERLALFQNTSMTGGFAGTEETPEIVGYGDLHVPFLKHVKSKTKSGLLLFNTGSVGAPYDGIPEACYTIIEGSTKPDDQAPFGLQWVRVPYDIDRAIFIAEQAGMPNMERFSSEQRSGLQQ